MRFRRSDKHVIDFIFPLAILFVFAASALLVLILSTHIYADQTDHAKANYQSYTPLAYISEKVRQNDVSGNISIQELDGTTCLALKGTSDDIAYITYLYVSDGWLKELLIRDDTMASLSAGKNIIEAKDLTIKELKPQVYQITITTDNGSSDSQIFTERSSK